MSANFFKIFLESLKNACFYELSLGFQIFSSSEKWLTTPFLHHFRENYEPCRDEIELILGSLLTKNHAQFGTYKATAATE